MKRWFVRGGFFCFLLFFGHFFCYSYFSYEPYHYDLENRKTPRGKKTELEMPAVSACCVKCSSSTAATSIQSIIGLNEKGAIFLFANLVPCYVAKSFWTLEHHPHVLVELLLYCTFSPLFTLIITSSWKGLPLDFGARL